MYCQATSVIGPTPLPLSPEGGGEGSSFPQPWGKDGMGGTPIMQMHSNSSRMDN